LAVSQSTYDQIKAASDAAQAEFAAAAAQEHVARDEGSYSELVANADGTVVETLAEPRAGGDGRANSCEARSPVLPTRRLGPLRYFTFSKALRMLP
jgi:hypothetical protein